jgi:tRNA (guanine-N7-)-methyltransferase
MKFAPNYFHPSQLTRMFILFPDPHFKRANHRRRVVTRNFVDLYAFVMREGGKLYVVTDVKELFEWMVEVLEGHELFERVVGEEMDQDVCVGVMMTATEEGKKVERLSGSKYPAVFRRIALRELDA